MVARSEGSATTILTFFLVITISDILNPKHVELDLKATQPEEAILEVASLLRNDDRVLDYTGLYEGLKTSSPRLEGDQDFDICIPHARTNCVQSMVMSVGRSKEGIPVPDSKARIRYIFVIGVPVALASDYLRIIGVIARVLKDKRAEKMLYNACNQEDVIKILSQMEIRTQ